MPSRASRPDTTTPAAAGAPLLVACLCAGWCRVCDSYQDIFDSLRAQLPAHRFVWVDIEDEDELMGDLDVETFPTLLIGQGTELRFIGPVLPQLAGAERLIHSLVDAGPCQANPAAQILLERLQTRA